MAITPLPTPPSRADANNFPSRGDAFMAALPLLATEITATEANIVAKDTNVTANTNTVVTQAAQVASNTAAAAASAAQAAGYAAQSLSPNFTDSSTSNVAIGTGAKAFVTSAGKGWVPGQTLLVFNSVGNSLQGQVVSYAGTALSINVTVALGSGSFAAWSISPVVDLGDPLLKQIAQQQAMLAFLNS